MPRTHRKRARSLCLRPYKWALVPARKMNAGATKCVTQRVKKIPAVGPPAGSPEETRTWAIAIRIITAPRIRSIDATRDADVVGTAGGGAAHGALLRRT